MRYQGKISEWNDDRGFGFIARNGDEEKTFVHVTALKSPRSKPCVGLVVTFEQTLDERGRKRAIRVQLARTPDWGAPRQPPPSQVSLAARQFSSIAFLSLIDLVCWIGKLPWIFLAGYVGASLWSFGLYGWDKASALNGGWRTPESSLHLSDLVGGWPGGLMAQVLFRHKIQKSSFMGTFWVTAVLNACVVGWFALSDDGAALVQGLLATH